MNTEHVAYPIHGYSERGVVNAVFETIAGHSKANRLLEDLLGRTVGWIWTSRPESRPNFEPGWVEKFEIYIEPSLSDFGTPDVLLLVKRSNGGGWLAFFIEAKMKPFLMSSPPTVEEIDEWLRDKDKGEGCSDYGKLASILSGCKFEDGDSEYWRKQWASLVGHDALPGQDKYEKNSSSLIHQLFLKYRFWQTHLRPGSNRPDWTSLTKGIPIYDSETTNRGQNAERDGSGGNKTRLRKIGKDPVVLRLVRWLYELAPDAYFVSLTTDPPPPADDETHTPDWPLGKAVTRRLQKICEWNGCKQCAGEWTELSHLLSWRDVRDWATKHKLKRVLHALKENEEKFTYWPTCASTVRSNDAENDRNSRSKP